MSHSLFTTIVSALELENQYSSAVTYFNNNETLVKIFSNIGANLLDCGDVLDSSLQHPSRFMKVTDALVDYLNNNLDTLLNADAMLSVLLETEVVAAECFLPELGVTANAGPGAVNLQYKGVGLSLGIFTSEPIDMEALDPSTILDEILDEAESRVNYAGRITIYDTGSIYWTPNSTAESEASTGEPELPGEVDASVPSQDAEVFSDGI